MNTPIEFLQKCLDLPTGNDFSFFIDNAILGLSSVNISKEHDRICKFLELANQDGSISTIAVGIRKCLEYCIQKKEKVQTAKSDPSLSSFINLLGEFAKDIEIVLKRPDEDAQNATELGNIKTILDSYDGKLKEMQKQLSSVSDDLKEQSHAVDSKVFQLLVNTIAILGIFVAIAFAGFGGTSIISSINIDLAADLNTGVFSIFLVALLIYNLLFLLVYFIYAILKNFYQSSRFPRRFMLNNEIRFWPFWAIDGVLFVITIFFYIMVKCKL